MKIAYVVNRFNWKKSDDTEGHLTYSLEKLGHEVLAIPEDRADEAIEAKADILLFHKGGSKIESVLPYIKYKKVCWYFDKVWKSRVQWMEKILPLVDLMCMTDETWAMQRPEKHIKILHQGIGDRDLRLGIKTPGYDADIAFTGNVYDDRGDWVAMLVEEFGNRFKVYDKVFNRDLFHLCASVPIFVAPQFPSDDYYWSSRIYLTLGSGGFLIHPRLEGLKEEFIEDVHYVGYSSQEELLEKIHYYLDHPEEREEIQVAGRIRTQYSFTYTKRVEKLIEYAKAH